MILRNTFNLGGKFKFDVFNRDNTLKYTSDYFDNFITPTGLNYIQTYAIADCFRYASLGSGSVPNTATGNNVVSYTGLQIPLGGNFAYIGGNRSHAESLCASADQVNQYVSKGCGYRVTNSGVSLLRAWRFPPDESQFITGDYVFKEYMLSPGRPPVTGWISFDELTTGSVCACNEAVYPIFGDSNQPARGKESADFATRYPNVCNDTRAFTRIVKDIQVNNNEYLILNYILDVGVRTGVTLFKVGVNRNSPVGASYNWVTGSGAYSMIHPGIKLINNGDVTSVSYANQITDYGFRAGESFVPPLGEALEISCSDSSRMGYISNDILQFLVNSPSGGLSGLFNGDNIPSGLMSFHKDYVTETSNNASSLGTEIETISYFNKPRSEITQSFSNAYPNQTDFSKATNYSTIADGTYIPTTLNAGVVSSALDNSLSFTGRNRARIVTLTFKDPTWVEKMPVRSFIYGYRFDSDSPIYMPNVDCIFFPSGGHPIPNINIATKTYPNPSGYVSSLGLTGYYYFDDFNNANILEIQVRNQVSSSCPQTISGCL